MKRRSKNNTRHDNIYTLKMWPHSLAAHAYIQRLVIRSKMDEIVQVCKWFARYIVYPFFFSNESGISSLELVVVVVVVVGLGFNKQFTHSFRLMHLAASMSFAISLSCFCCATETKTKRSDIIISNIIIFHFTNTFRVSFFFRFPFFYLYHFRLPVCCCYKYAFIALLYANLVEYLDQKYIDFRVDTVEEEHADHSSPSARTKKLKFDSFRFVFFSQILKITN